MGASPSQDLPELHGRSVSSAVSAMHPERSASASTAAKPQMSFAMGEAGEFVGRIRLRQEVAGKNYIVCDILSNWEQDKLQINDIIFAD